MEKPAWTILYLLPGARSFPAEIAFTVPWHHPPLSFAHRSGSHLISTLEPTETANSFALRARGTSKSASPIPASPDGGRMPAESAPATVLGPRRWVRGPSESSESASSDDTSSPEAEDDSEVEPSVRLGLVPRALERLLAPASLSLPCPLQDPHFARYGVDRPASPFVGGRAAAGWAARGMSDSAPTASSLPPSTPSEGLILARFNARVLRL